MRGSEITEIAYVHPGQRVRLEGQWHQVTKRTVTPMRYARDLITLGFDTRGSYAASAETTIRRRRLRPWWRKRG